MLPDDFRVRSVDGVADDWPLGYDELRPYYEETDRQFGVSGFGGNPAYPPGDDPPLPPMPLGEVGLRVARAHHRLGWHWWPASQAILSAPYEGRHVCVRRGTCGQGCNEGAKGSSDVTHWPAFLAAGGELVTGARVRRITVGADGLATGAEWVDRDGNEHHQAAATVLVAANGVGTARVLLASADVAHPDGLANSSGLVGRRLMLHPLATVLGVFDDPVQAWPAQNGALIQTMEFARSDPERGFLRGSTWGLGCTGGPVRMALSPGGRGVWGAGHHANVEARLGRIGQWAILCEDLPEEHNRVELDLASTDSDGLPGARVSYRMSENSRQMMAFMAERAEESLREAGASTIETVLGIPNGHLMGTARMGDDPTSSVVDRFGMAHDVPNLGVVDGSVFVTAGSANPTTTIAALALRTAEHLVETRGAVAGWRPSLIAVGAPPVRPSPPQLVTPAPPVVDDGLRERFALVAEAMVPADDRHPGAGDVDVAGVGLDRVLTARPDLLDPLARALSRVDRTSGTAITSDEAEALLDHLDADDRRGAAALRTSVAAAYHSAPEARAAYGYGGQQPSPVPPFGYPDWLDEGLLDHLL
jgi:choline dehydrogenase-like flavoprotein